MNSIKKKYAESFRMVTSGATFLGIINTLDQCKFFTSSICYGVLHQLAQFPSNPTFFKWKEQFYSNPADVFQFKNNSDFDIALTDLNLIEHKTLILQRIYDFSFIQLPIIYGIKPKYLKQIELKYFKEQIHELTNVLKEFEHISSKDLSFVNVKIGDSVRGIYNI